MSDPEWSSLASANASSRLLDVAGDAIHLSDGTAVWAEYDIFGGNLVVCYSSDHSTRNVIATLASLGGFSQSGGQQAVALMRDASDNLYLVGTDVSSPFTVACLALAKGVGFTWSVMGRVSGITAGINWAAASWVGVWCNTGGGTNSKGHLLMIGQLSSGTGYMVFDAGVALAGSGSLMTSSGANPAFLANTTAATASNLDISSDGFGATSGIVAYPITINDVQAGAWSVNSSGALGTNTKIGSTGAVATLGAATKIRIVRTASNLWAVIAPSTTAGRYMTARYSSTAKLTEFTDSGAPTNMPLNGATPNWDVYLDPLTTNRFWILATGTQSGSNLPMWRVSVNVSSGVTYAGGATADAVLTPVTGAIGTTVSDGGLRCVKQPVSTLVDWQVFVTSAAAPTYALYGDYTLFNSAPNAPTLVAPPTGSSIDDSVLQRFSWLFSDPNLGDTQSKFDLDWRPLGSSSWTTITGATPNNFYDFPAGFFSVGTFEWRVRTYDALGFVGPYSSVSQVAAIASPSAPTITNPVNGGTITSGSDVVSWSTSAQDSYQIRKVADLAGSPDTTIVYFDTGEVVAAGVRSLSVAFPVNGRFEHVQVRVKVSGLWSSWASVRVLVSYTPPATPTTNVSDTAIVGAIVVSATHPTPSGSQPAVVSMDIERRLIGALTGIRIATGLPPTQQFVDYAVVSRVAYEYRVLAVGVNGTGSYSLWEHGLHVVATLDGGDPVAGPIAATADGGDPIDGSVAASYDGGTP